MAIRHHAVLALLMSMPVLPAPATSVQKCRRPDGAVVYQSAACAAGERLLARWEAEPDPPARVASHAPPARPPRMPKARRTRAPRRAWMAASADPCRDAKERRDAIERRVGLARTYELLTALQREVYDACR